MPGAFLMLAGQMSEVLTDVHAIAVGAGEHKPAHPVAGITKAPDDADAMPDAMLVDRCRVVDHQVRDVLRGRPVLAHPGQVQFGVVFDQDDEPDRVAVLEDFPEAQGVAVEGDSAAEVRDKRRPARGGRT